MLNDENVASRSDAVERRRLGVRALAAGLLAIAADQIVKGVAVLALPYGQPIPTAIPGLDLRLVLNPGAAFGFGAGVGPLLAAGVLVVLVVLTTWIIRRVIREENPTVTVLLAVAAGGGWGNMIDRVFRGHQGIFSGAVIDYFSVSWFAVFNLADVFTVCGIVAALAIATFQQSRTRRDAFPAGRRQKGAPQ
ncbi:signal peptidase II (plasmid) [Streptomyces sp. L7]|uniref:signal peptidase II n=1 Tax=Streptomyces sp. L7 TaxID=3423954 RepID=UPI000E202E84|nr:signal peptidase II [Leifsonia sp. ku-ls]